jgi:flavin-dependent dehydrogenase
MEWLSTGPLVFANSFDEQAESRVYPAGDSLSFVDPFTGTGITAALITGEFAGRAAATGLGASEYVAQCRRTLGRPFAAASLFRAALHSSLAETAAMAVPASWLVRWTRLTQKQNR